MGENTLALLKGLGPARKQALMDAGVCSLRDLILLYPKEYRDLSVLRDVASITEGEISGLRLVISGEIKQMRIKKLLITQAYGSDQSGVIRIVWYNQPWLKKQIKGKRELLLFGRAERQRGILSLINPSIEDDMGIHPVYKTIPGVPARVLREFIQQALELGLENLNADLPAEIRERFDLLGKREALMMIHRPGTMESLAKAKRTLAFEELLLYQVTLGRYRRDRGTGCCCPCSEDDILAYWRSLEFQPTQAQERVLKEIADDMSSGEPMARMVQGDVGSGKTAVAFGAMYLSSRCGFQSALMVPTEVLAHQHYIEARRILEPLGCRVGYLTGNLSASGHQMAHEAIREGRWDVIIGTHALITDAVQYKRLGLVITDEQHRFGVRQRTMLSSKGDSPNVLVMSATPIPRTLSLILYGDLDISVIDQLPPGREPVQTRIVPESKRSDLYRYLKKEVESGRQAYVVCPLIEESEAVDARSAQELLQELRERYLGTMRTELIHGKLKSAEKDEILERFRSGEVDVLISTTVIEVGVNVPNASIMIVENAERFGLAQLHQLRGRVGRGMTASWCFLVAQSSEKLRFLASTSDGFRIAEKDMEIRGPGEIFGLRQSGPINSFGDLFAADAVLLSQTHDLAGEILSRKDAVSDIVMRLASAKYGERQLSLN